MPVPVPPSSVTQQYRPRDMGYRWPPPPHKTHVHILQSPHIDTSYSGFGGYAIGIVLVGAVLVGCSSCMLVCVVTYSGTCLFDFVLGTPHIDTSESV